MSASYTAGRYKAWFDNGTQAAGGRAYTYAPGTSTHKDAYTDSTFATPCTYTSDGAGGQYIALNARGEASIWLLGLYDIVTKTAAGGLITSDEDQGNTAADNVYTPAGTDAVATTVQTKLRERVSVKDFGAVGDGSADDTVALQAARDYIADNATSTFLFFPPGIYKYSVSPNWAIHHSHVEFEGHVILRYTGAGNAVIFDASAADAVVYVAGLCYSLTWGWNNRPTIEAPSTAGHGIYVRSIHHSKIGGRVRGCGTSSSGLQVEFAVITEFDVAVTGNQDGWYNSGSGSAKPANGYYLTRRDPGEQCSYCTFVNPIVEGLPIGIYLYHTLGNTFLGGTAEACTQYGVYQNTVATQDKFYGTDFEVNTTADVYALGTGLVLQDCDTYSDLVFGTTAEDCTVRGGRHSTILLDTGSSNCIATDLWYNRFNDGSTMQDAGTENIIENVRNVGTGLKYLTASSVSAGVVGIANGTTSSITSIAVVGSKLGDFVKHSYSVSHTGLTRTAEISSDGFARAVFTNNSGGTVNLPAGTLYLEVTRR